MLEPNCFDNECTSLGSERNEATFHETTNTKVIRRRRSRTWHDSNRFIVFTLLLTLLNYYDVLTTTTNKSKWSVNAFSIKSYPYIYPTKEEAANSSWPVHDYISTKKAYRALLNDRPKFLYAPEPDTYRIVEYYVHWCGRCRAFKSHYIAITKKIVELAALKQKKLEVYAVSCTPNKPLCTNQGIKGYPKVMLYQPGSTDGELVPFQSFTPYNVLQKFGIEMNENELDNWDLDNAVADAEKDIVPFNVLDVGDWSGSNNNTNPSYISKLFGLVNEDEHKEEYENHRQLEIKHHKRTRTELKNDIHLSFDFIMRHGVFVEDGPLSSVKRQALHSFLHVIQLTVPSSWTAFHNLLSEIMIDFNYVAKSELYLLGILDDHPVPNNVTEWSLTCNKGDINAGFTCGIWELFHAISVGTVGYNRIAEQPLGLDNVARAIREFIEFFFTCDVCRENFIKSYDACDHDRCNRLITPRKDPHKGKIKYQKEEDEVIANQYNVSHGMELALWLFEVHNSVNVRLLHERTEQRAKTLKINIPITKEEEYDLMWPSRYSICERCWYPQTNKYHRDNIIYYLQMEYGEMEEGDEDERMIQFHTSIANETRHLQMKQEEIMYEKIHFKYRSLQTTIYMKLLLFGIGLCILAFSIVRYYTAKRNKTLRAIHKKNDD